MAWGSRWGHPQWLPPTPLVFAICGGLWHLLGIHHAGFSLVLSSGETRGGIQ
jgi:hypothetical protein